jgi:hypothetical protein
VYTLGGILPKFLRTLKAIEAQKIEAQKQKPQEAAAQPS